VRLDWLNSGKGPDRKPGWGTAPQADFGNLGRGKCAVSGSGCCMVCSRVEWPSNVKAGLGAVPSEHAAERGFAPFWIRKQEVVNGSFGVCVEQPVSVLSHQPPRASLGALL